MPLPTQFQLGINYWPRKSGMYAWSQFDASEMDEDFRIIASLGLEAVRFFLLWEDFQPTPDQVSPTSLDRLKKVMDLLHRHKLKAMPTFFTGHMSGVNWLPEWTLDPSTSHGRFRTISRGKFNPYGIGDFYTGKLLEAQRLQIQKVAAALKGHPALWVWDLGNEFSNLREPNSAEDAANWSKILTEDLLHVSGVGATGGIHGEDITRDRQILPSSIAKPWVFTTMHGYSVYSDFARDRLDAEVVPFLSEVASACSQKRVLFSEFGNPTCPPGTESPYDRVPLPGETVDLQKNSKSNPAPFACLTEKEMCDYAYGVLDRLQKRGALGAYWWCYADYAKAIAHLPPFDLAPHELTFGIVRQDGSLKPVAETLSRFAREKRKVIAAPPFILEEKIYFNGFPKSLPEAFHAYVERKL